MCSARVGGCAQELKPETELGFHGHHNLAMGVANSLAAVEAGANRIDGSAGGPRCRRRQHAAGGVPGGAAIAWAWKPGVDLFKAMDVAEDLVVPMMDQPGAGRPRLAHPGLRRGLLQLPAVRQARRAKYGVSSRDILVELGRRAHGGRPGGHDRGPGAGLAGQARC
jgi:4-hydroxy-2-oxovalerate/4-hydroxy-2-oxohexanoate aldolase